MPAVWCPGARSRSRLTNTRASGRCAIFAVHRCCLSPVRERPQGISGAHDCSSWAGILCDAVIISAEFDGESSLPVCGTGPQAARQSWKSSGGRIGNGNCYCLAELMLGANQSGWSGVRPRSRDACALRDTGLYGSVRLCATISG